MTGKFATASLRNRVKDPPAWGPLSISDALVPVALRCLQQWKAVADLENRQGGGTTPRGRTLLPIGARSKHRR